MSKFKNVLGQIKIVIWWENQILVGRESTGETFLVGGEHANFRVHGGFPPLVRKTLQETFNKQLSPHLQFLCNVDTSSTSALSAEQ